MWEAFFWTLAGNYKKFTSTRFFKMMIRDKDLFKQSVDRILALDIERIVLPHGELVLENPKEKLRLAFQWLK
jgi:hypothetical protein